MKAVKLSAAMAVLLIAEACISSCSDHPRTNVESAFTAPPSRFVTVAGTGPNGDPESKSGWLEDPIDLTTGADDDILVLTKTNGRVLAIRKNGSRSQIASLPEPGDALSIRTQPDGSTLVAQVVHATGKLAIWRIEGNGVVAKVTEQPAPRNPENTHLVSAPDGKVLLLKDGKLQEQTPSSGFEPLQSPKGLPHSANILAASKDGRALMVVLPDRFAWIEGGRVIRHLNIASIDAKDGATIAPDGSGGAFLARYGAGIYHYSSDGRNGTVLIGYGGITACGEGTVSGATGDASQQKIGKVSSLLDLNKQLYFADPECHRILSIGLPAKEYVRP